MDLRANKQTNKKLKAKETTASHNHQVQKTNVSPEIGDKDQVRRWEDVEMR